MGQKVSKYVRKGQNVPKRLFQNPVANKYQNKNHNMYIEKLNQPNKIK